MRSKLPIIGLALLLAGAVAACDRDNDEGKERIAMTYEKASEAPAWTRTLAEYLPALGHRNWIVVADSAFPLQISPGIETITTGEDHFAVLKKVLEMVDGAKHITPKIWLDKELAYVPEALAPGADEARRRLDEMLEGRGAAPLLHADLIARLDEVGRTFKIVMVKTTLAVPYTTVFLELDCGYWGPAAEAKMREKMK
jgi:L-fucose mutarotase/ribose pyranase (RbsD/FucU family)